MNLLSDINEALGAAVENQDLKKVRELLSAGADPNYVPRGEEYKASLLHCTDSVKIIKELLNYGAEVDKRNWNGTPLITAVTLARSAEFVKVLLKHGANVEARDIKLDTPLNIAVKKKCKNLLSIKALLQYGADINARNQECPDSESNFSPFDNAAMYYPECAKIFIKFTVINNFDKDISKIVNLSPYKNTMYYNELSRYFEDCICEIERMKNIKITSNLSLYNFVTTIWRHIDLSYLNKISKSIKNGIFQVPTINSFPIHHDVIWHRVFWPYSYARAKLLVKLDKMVFYTELELSSDMEDFQERIIKLDSDSKEEVAQYLPNNDLSNFIKAFYSNEDKPLCSEKNVTEFNFEQNKRECEDPMNSSSKCAKLK